MSAALRVQETLRSVGYSNEILRQQASILLSQPVGLGLNPKSDTFVYNDGSSAQLFKLEGTIPMFFKKDRYNTPVAFWIEQAFPEKPPICFVVPTSGKLF